MTERDRSLGLPYTTRSEYDHAGRAVLQANALEQTERSEYDALGRLAASWDRKGNRTGYSYDSLGRLTERRSPFDGDACSVTRYRYDWNGNVIATETSSGMPGGAEAWRVTENGYDSRNRLAWTRSYNGEGWEYSGFGYDEAGNQTDAYTGGHMEGGEVEYLAHSAAEYGHLGNVVSRTDGMGQRESYVYDSYGLLQEKTDRNGNVFRYAYDALGRAVMTSAAKPGGEEETLSVEYTLTGQIASTVSKASPDDPGIALSYRYDSRGQVVSETERSGDGTVTKVYAYDAAGNRTAMGALDGDVLRAAAAYEYDALNRLECVLEEGKAVASYRYDANGNRVQSAAGPVTARYEYNDGGLVTGVTNRSASGVLLSGYMYEYGLDGNQARKAEYTGKATAYEYDGLGRLSRETESGTDSPVTRAYSYDWLGNRGGTRVSGAENYGISYEYDLNNRLLGSVKEADNGAVSTTAYEYDPDGNQLRKETEAIGPPSGSDPSIGFEEDASGIGLMEYDAFGKLAWALEGSVQAEYTYRPDGLRHSKEVDGALTVHIWDGSNIIFDRMAGGSGTKYLRGAGLIARQEEAGGEYEYYLRNAHGDVVQMADASGEVTREYGYDAFGVETDPDDGDLNPFRYCGEYFDNETGTYYLRARYYAPRLGRFTQQDTHWNNTNNIYGDNPQKIGNILVPSSGAIRQSSNLYVYCSNNPILFIDPTGLCAGCASNYLSTQQKPTWTYNPGGYGYAAYKENLASYWVKHDYELKRNHPAAVPPPASALQGSNQSLASQIINHPSYKHQPTAYAQLQLVAQGHADYISGRILYTILGLYQTGQEFTITSIYRPESKGSLHYTGQAFDVVDVNGDDLGWYDYRFAQGWQDYITAADLIISPSPFESVEIGAPVRAPVYSSSLTKPFYDKGTAPHIHIGIK